MSNETDDEIVGIRATISCPQCGSENTVATTTDPAKNEINFVCDNEHTFAIKISELPIAVDQRFTDDGSWFFGK